MRRLLDDIATRLARGERPVIATILSKTGSAPRSDGATMLVLEDGSIRGSVGGGLLEAETIAAARVALGTRRAQVRTFDLAGEAAAGSGMICGGRGELLVDPLEAGDAELFAAAAAAVAERRNGWLLTWLADDAAARHGLLLDDGRVSGRCDDPERLSEWLETGAATRAIRVETLGDARVVAEPLAVASRLLVFGAGHCARALAPLAESVGFRTEVLDDRAAFANRERFPDASAVTVIDGFEQLPELGIDDRTYLVIVTRGHLHDRTVLQWALGTPAGYVGMIGSVRKRDRTFDELRRAGVADTQLARVHSPIGVEIDAETPEEIAISIVGELVRERARLEGRTRRAHHA